MNSHLAVEIQALTKIYRRQSGFWDLTRLSRAPEVPAIDRVSLAIERGEIFGLLGPNGSGKTTLIKMLCTLLLPTAGTARVCGYDTVRDGIEVKRRIGLVASDERSFYWRLTGRQNLNFFGALYGLSGRDLRRRVEEVLATLDLTALADVRFNEYSTGMKQKLAIARGALHRPQILFMDEPTRGLDPIASQGLLSLIRPRLVDAWGCTVILATHILREAEILCNRIAILKTGRILVSQTIDELRHRFQDREEHVIRVANLDDRSLSDLARIPGLLACRKGFQSNGFTDLEVELRKNSTALSELLGSIVRARGTILRCDRREPSLETMFHLLIGETAAVNQEGPC